MLISSFLTAQNPEALLKGFDNAKTPKDKIDLLVKVADQYTDKKDFQKALEYRARAVKLNKAEAVYKFDDSVLTRGLSEGNFQALSLAQFKSYVSRLPQDILTADFLNILANQTITAYNSDYSIELAQKAMILSMRKGDKLQQATAYFMMSRYYYNSEGNKAARINATKSLEIYTAIQDTVGMVRSLRILGTSSDPDEAAKPLNDAVALAKHSKNEVLIYETLMRLRDLRLKQGNFKEAQAMEVSIHESALKTRDSFKIMESISDMGITHHLMGNYRQALPLFLPGLNYDETHKKYNFLSFEYYMIGSCYRGMGVYDTAVMYYQKSIEISKKHSNMNNLCKSLQDMVMLYDEIGDKNTAGEYAEQVKQLYQSLDIKNNPVFLSRYYQWQADFLNKTGKTDSAVVYAQKYLDLLNKRATTWHIPAALHTLGELYLLLGEREIASEQLLRALQMSRDIGMEGQQCKTLLSLSELVVQEGKYSRAIQYLEESLDLAQKLNQRNLLRDIYRNLSTTYADAGDFKAAYRYQSTLKNLEDSLFGFVQKEQIAKFEASFKVKEKELENDRLKTEKEGKDYTIQKRNSLIMSLGVIIVFLLLAAYLLKERAKIKAEYKLRKQITRDIHDDVGSTLNDLKMTIKAAIEVETDAETAQGKLSRALELGNQAMESMKNLIWKLDEKPVTTAAFANELKTLTRETLLPHQIPYQLDVEGFEAAHPVSPRSYHHFLMIYKEALQNAVKHGDHRNISIRLTQVVDSIFFSLKNGVPSSEAIKTGTNKGLSNIRERASLLKGEVVFKKAEGFFELQLQAKF